MRTQLMEGSEHKLLSEFRPSFWFSERMGMIRNKARCVMTNFYDLPYKERLRRASIGFPIGSLCALALYFVFGIPLWIALVFIAFGIIQLVYLFLKSQDKGEA